jgi:hypothetical protein
MDHIENDASSNSLVACVFVTTVTFLPSRCLATIGGFLPSNCLATIGGFFSKPLPSNYGGILTDLLPSNDRGDTHRDLISLLLFIYFFFFQNKESRLKIHTIHVLASSGHHQVLQHCGEILFMYVIHMSYEGKFHHYD